MSGVTIFCDPSLRPAIRALALLAGTDVAILSAPAPSMVEQIRRHTRDDILVTISTTMDQAASQNFIDPKTRIDGFSNPLVLAALGTRAAGLARKITSPGTAAGLRIAVTDNTVISNLDGKSLLAANGFSTGSNTLIGTASTQDALFLLLTNAVDMALVYQTDAKSDPAIVILTTLTAVPALTAFSAAINAKAVSPTAQSVLGVMRSPPGIAALTAAGLEIAT